MAIYRIHPNEPRLGRFSSTEFGAHYQEEHLENWIGSNPEVLMDGDPILIIGRQVTTDLGGAIDLLALDENGSTIIVELKRGPTPRDVVAQSLEYAACIGSLDEAGIRSLASAYLKEQDPPISLDEAWRQTFVGSSDPDGGDSTDTFGDLVLNAHQRIIVVTEGTNERIKLVIRYLRSLDLDIGLLEYRYYQTEAGEEILDIEIGVDIDQPPISPVPSPRPPRHTEREVLDKWDSALVEAYQVFRDHLLQQDGVALDPKATMISFRLQTRDENIYVCSFGSVKEGACVWMNRISMQKRLDFDASLDAMDKAAPKEIQVEKNREWTTLKFPVDDLVAEQVADLVIEHIISKLM